MPSLAKMMKTVPNVLFSKDSWKTFADYVGLGRAKKIETIENSHSLEEFLNARSSHVSQTSLYGYLRTRAGTRYPELFENPGILISINMAKWQIWLACLSDLTIYMGGLINQRTGINSDKIAETLSSSVKNILEQTGIPEEASPEFSNTAEELCRRVANCDYSTIEDNEKPFSKSPESLFYWAPVADELKNRDKEIVKNSVRFRWQEIRRSAREQLDAEALMESVSTTS